MSLFEQLLPTLKLGQPVQVITIIGTPQDKRSFLGQMLAINEGELSGLLVDPIFTELVANTIQKTAWQKPSLLTIEYYGQHRLFWDCWQGRSAALVLGGGHISQPLVEFLTLTGFSVTVVDDRPDFANKARFPGAAKVICDSFTNALKTENTNKFQAAIIVTRGHRHDLECLRTLINAEILYLGMIGSRRRVAGIRQLLLEEGIAMQRLKRLYAPIGIDIGAQTPAEIALSIAAEVIAVLRGGKCLSLRLQKEEV